MIRMRYRSRTCRRWLNVQKSGPPTHRLGRGISAMVERLPRPANDLPIRMNSLDRLAVEDGDIFVDEQLELAFLAFIASIQPLCHASRFSKSQASGS